MSQSNKSGVRVTAFTKSSARVTGLGTRLNPWEFAKRQFEIKIIVENGTVATTPIYITEDMDGSVSVVGNNGYAFDSVSCTNSQNAVYENGKINIKSIFANTECTVKFVNPGKTISYKEEEQTYDVKYSGYYELDAYGAQGNGSGGKGGHTYGKVYLEKDTKLVINTGGKNGYNGGGSGYYSGGGSTTVTLFGGDLMIAAGGGGGKNGTAGGNGDSKGGASSGGSGKYNGGGAAGSNGLDNHGGGGSGYDYTYADTYNDCKTGSNTCTGGMVSKNCSSCYSTECVGGMEEYDCDDCASTEEVCVKGTAKACNTCTYYGKTCSNNYTYRDGYCYGPSSFSVSGSCECKNGKSFGNCTDVGCYGRERDGYTRNRSLDLYAGYKTYAEACNKIPNGTITVTGVCTTSSPDKVRPDSYHKQNCDECGFVEYESSCATKETRCVRGCKTKYNSCLTRECVYGCDSVYDPCATGKNTCQGGWNYKTKPYNSGNGGSNLLGDDLKDSKSESGINTGNGYVKISYYKETL